MSRHHAQALAHLLEGGLSRAETARRTRPLVDLAKTLQSSATPRPRPQFKAGLRAKLLTQARTLPAPPPPLLARVRGTVDQITRWRYSARVAAATGATALVLSGGGAVAIATERALPGDLLYPAKLVLEDWRLALTQDQADRGAVLLTHAAERVDEARVLAESGDQQAAAQALREADEAARAAAQALISSYERSGDPALLGRLAGFAAEQRGRVTALAGLLDPVARHAAEDVLVVLHRIEQRLAVVTGCAQCGVDSQLARRPRSGEAFNFGDVPAASEQFQPCPCVPPPAPAAAAPPAASAGTPDQGAQDPAGQSSSSAPTSAVPGERPSGEEPAASQPPAQPEPRRDDHDDQGARAVPAPLPEPRRGNLVNELISELLEPVDVLNDTVDGVTDGLLGP